jgi:hypothetical protein
MKIILKPVTGTPEANLQRAKIEMERVLSFRGTVGSVKALGKTIEVKINISPSWDLPQEQKVDSLNQWITAKVRTVFTVVSIST